MFTQIVVLYMTYHFDLPTWCQVLSWIAMVISIVSFVCENYKAGKNS